MRKNHLSLAVTAALLAGAQGANAAYTSGTTPDLEIYISGASAQDKGIDLLIRNVLQVNDGNLVKFIDVGTAAGTQVGKAQTAWTFTLDKAKVTGLTITGSAAGGNPIVTVHKYSSGGSFNGIGPLLGSNPSNVPTSLSYMAISAANCNASFQCNTSGAGATVSKIPDLGVADVNTEMFQGLNVPTGTAVPPVAKASTLLNEKEAAGVAFGIVVNNNLYNALQDAQIANGQIVPPAGGCPQAAQTGGNTSFLPATGGTSPVSGYGTAVGDDTCMPSLSKAQVTALLGGDIASWEKIQVRVGAANKPLTDASFDPGVTSGILGGVAPVVHCTRVAGSGTKATANAVFLNAPCTANGEPPATAYDVTNGPAVMQMSGSGGVESCLSDADNATSTATDVNLHNVGLDFGSKFWAFGIQSTENNAALTKPYRFVKIAGYAPTIKNTAEGKYIDWSEQAFVWRKDFSTGTWNTAANKPQRLAVLTQIANSTGSPSVVASLNAGFNHGFGQAGLLALASNGFAQTIPFVATNPVTAWTHKAGTVLDNCRAPTHNNTDQLWDLK
ncbi:MAG: hypothetical protein FIA97_11610 [Methylococcaceae bacterium]|nr:hypothetical protein [Methylococcaceae bacterium]